MLAAFGWRLSESDAVSGFYWLLPTSTSIPEDGAKPHAMLASFRCRLCSASAGHGVRRSQ